MSAISFTSVISLCNLLSWYQIKNINHWSTKQFYMSMGPSVPVHFCCHQKYNFVGTTCSTDVYSHYSDVIASTMMSQIIGVKMVCSTVSSGADKTNIKDPRYWPLWGEFTSNRWIPLTKGKQRGKCFLLMTSSWWWTGPQKYIPMNILRIWYSHISVFFILNSIFISYFQLTDELLFVFYCTFQFGYQLNPSTCIWLSNCCMSTT